MHNATRVLAIVAAAGALSLFSMGCESGQDSDNVSPAATGEPSSSADHPKGEHPDNGEHPNAEHPEGDHPEGDHPEGDHPDG